MQPHPRSQPRGMRMPIFIKMMTGRSRTITLHVQNTDTISTVKAMIFFLNRGAFSPRSRALCTEILRSPGFEPGMAGMGLWPHVLATTACRSVYG
jgi:hypothetical protein